ncbi:MAG TPA: Ku protein [Steroidobacteraceae bacterium]|jgi:DNA end-binding protein Ku|nr:Ku protein [Steroidobacteraceae bacterium]
MPTSTRPIASVTLSFGLVAIPVQVYSATEVSERIAFNFLRAKDGSRVRQQYVAVKDGKVVERADMAKGYEFAKDRFVMFSPQELKELEEKTSRAIEISEFVPLQSVDPVYYAGTYLLAPEKGGAKPYALLTTALKHTAQCAVGRWVSRGKEHVVVIRPFGTGLALHPLHFQGELRPMSDLGIESGHVSAAELKLATQLIEQLAVKKFDPGEFTDEFKDRVAAAIKRKLHGEEVSLAAAPTPKRASNVVDLMAALKASLDRTPTVTAPSRAPKRATPATSRKARRR